MAYTIEDIGTKFYVYFLVKPDGTIFYVGKGRGRRYRSTIYHNPHNRHKQAVIDKYGEPHLHIANLYEDELEALAAEDMWMRLFGLSRLTNAKYNVDESVILGNTKPVYFEGFWFPSRACACRCLNIGKSSLERYIRKGLSSRPEIKPNHTNPVKIGEVSYSSVSEACKSLGISKSTYYYLLKNGGLDGINKRYG